MRVFIEDTFDSAHWLPNVPPDHKCHNLHGHTYRIRMEIEGEVDATTGWVLDYAEVKSIWDVLKNRVDHHCLNELVELENSTCENLVIWLWNALKTPLPGLARIEIRETERCGVVYEGGR